MYWKLKLTPAVVGLLGTLAFTQDGAPKAAPATSKLLISNVRIFAGQSDQLSGSMNVLIQGNTIQKISAAPIATDRRAETVLMDGGGRTLMPGLIDAHTHLMFAAVPQLTLLLADIGFVKLAAAKAANEMLLRGFTSVRDLGGPVFGLKRAIETGLAPGPRIWPIGAFISQTGGHGDFRLPTDFPAKPSDYTYAELLAQLLALNQQVAANLEKGERVTAPDGPKNFTAAKQLMAAIASSQLQPTKRP